MEMGMNHWELEGMGIKLSYINVGLRMEMGMNHWELEGMGIKLS